MLYPMLSGLSCAQFAQLVISFLCCVLFLIFFVVVQELQVNVSRVDLSDPLFVF